MNRARPFDAVKMNIGPRSATFSFLVPTRNNVRVLGNFLDSIRDTTSELGRVEVVLCIDADDEMTLHYKHSGIRCVRTVAAPGSTMGALNNHCLAAASGDYVMLLNDDVLLRTRDWDSRVCKAIQSAADPHVLIHVNDLIFGPALCTFPLLSRTTVEKVGLCPPDFRRYAIDDHIMEVFHILRCLGHDRIRYLDDVIFEHLNFEIKGENRVLRTYITRTPPEHDWALFKTLLPLRKAAALALALDIDGHRQNEERYRQRLEIVRPDKQYRKLLPLSLPGRIIDEVK